jgi:hypothetical protein
MPPPQFVTVGHAVRDLVPGGWRLGGTITFAAVQAHKLDRSVGIVTRAGADLDLPALFPFAEIAGAVSRETTTFENVYEQGARRSPSSVPSSLKSIRRCHRCLTARRS